MDIQNFILANQDLLSLKRLIEGKSYTEVKSLFGSTSEEENCFYCGFHHIGVYITNERGLAQLSDKNGIEIWDDMGNQVAFIY